MRIAKLKSLIPEIFLIVSVIYYWILTANLFNPIAMGLLAILMYQVINRKPLSGLLISGVFIGLNLFMVLALISELSEFETVNQNYKNLIVFGYLYLGCNLLIGSIMFIKYLKLKIH
ncbi:hypothetical protein [uncultured Winogradskyella sp.]|uniref:hypothetical protein n=1 Tax=uncultured Winogradskyella sp. TaxID=395353 RepID=UPI002622C9F6|nr:hypothetical protein [uncultured Winogradskyella sp.]